MEPFPRNNRRDANTETQTYVRDLRRTPLIWKQVACYNTNFHKDWFRDSIVEGENA
jgi:hypothetical protein